MWSIIDGIKSTEFALVFLGAFLGIGSSILGTLIIGPWIERLTGFRIRKFLGAYEFWRDGALVGYWQQTWTVKDNGKDVDFCSDIKIYSFMNLIAGEFSYAAKDGARVEARIVGVIRRGISLEGEWFNAGDPNGYRGTFQLIRSGDSRRFEGHWIGSSDAQGCKSGRWVWARIDGRPNCQR